MRSLLLVSSSKTHGTEFLEHCRDAIAQHLAGIGRLLFIPHALADHEAYSRVVRQALEPLGVAIDALHEAADPQEAVNDAEAVFCGGGNTFRLLKTLYDLQLIGPLRGRIMDGMPYLGSSAGTNIACPSIRTTNDMPIVQPPDFSALNVVPFQINPHFTDAVPGSTHQGETREQRLQEYLEENEIPVVGIREGCWLQIHGNQGQVGGRHGGVLFRRGASPYPLSPGGRLDDLLSD